MKLANLMRNYRGKIILSAMIFMVVVPLAIAQEGPGRDEFPEADNLMAMSEREALTYIERLNSQEAAALVSQIRFLARDNNPDLDRLYYVLKHFETLQATELAGRRLSNLFTVLIVTLLLFVSFLIYIVYDQRRTLRRLEPLLKSEPGTDSSEGHQVYRGE